MLFIFTWWRHDTEFIFVLLAPCEGNPPVTDKVPSEKNMNVAMYFAAGLYKLLDKQSSYR